jgi:hypothetical protein
MKKVLPLFALLLLVYSRIFAQASVEYDITIKFVEDGACRALKDDFKIWFTKGKDTLSATVSADKIRLPCGIKNGDKTTMLFEKGQHNLVFYSFNISVNDKNPTWEIGVDTAPFDKDKYWTIKEWRNIQLIYYISDNNGGLMTVRR